MASSLIPDRVLTEGSVTNCGNPVGARVHCVKQNKCLHSPTPMCNMNWYISEKLRGWWLPEFGLNNNGWVISGDHIM